MAANGPTLLLNPHSGTIVLGMVLWAIGSGGRGVVIVLESAWMVIALGCWSSRTRVRSIACFSSRGWVWARRSAVSTAKVSEDPVSVSAQVVALAGNARKVIARQSSTVQHRLDEARAGIEPSTSPSCADIAH